MKFQRLNDYDYFFCDACRKYIYDEAAGDRQIGLPPRTLVDHLPAQWKCPKCGASADQLRPATMVDDYAGDEGSARGQSISNHTKTAV